MEEAPTLDLDDLSPAEEWDRDANGYLQLDQSHAAFDYLWLANSSDWNRGTVSKVNSKTVREVVAKIEQEVAEYLKANP